MTDLDQVKINPEPRDLSSIHDKKVAIFDSLLVSVSGDISYQVKILMTNDFNKEV